jgi:hypothetical protein
MNTHRSGSQHRPARQVPESLLLLSLVAILVGLFVPAVFKVKKAVSRAKVRQRLNRHFKDKDVQLRRITWEGSSRVTVDLGGNPASRGELKEHAETVFREVFTCGLPVQQATVVIYRESTEEVLFEATLTGEEGRAEYGTV